MRAGYGSLGRPSTTHSRPSDASVVKSVKAVRGLVYIRNRTYMGVRAGESPLRLRGAASGERAELEALQRRSSEVWEQYREQLAAHPEAIEMPEALIDNGWVRVAVTDAEVIVGFSVVISRSAETHELDGLFVEPVHMYLGIGRMLVEDACRRARAAGASGLEVVAGPAQAFYEKLGFCAGGHSPDAFRAGGQDAQAALDRRHAARRVSGTRVSQARFISRLETARVSAEGSSRLGPNAARTAGPPGITIRRPRSAAASASLATRAGETSTMPSATGP